MDAFVDGALAPGLPVLLASRFLLGVAIGGFWLAIALGAVVGGLLVDGVTVTAPLLVGGIATIAGGALLASLRKRG